MCIYIVQDKSINLIKGFFKHALYFSDILNNSIISLLVPFDQIFRGYSSILTAFKIKLKQIFKWLEDVFPSDLFIN